MSGQQGAPVLKAEVIETVASLLRRFCPFLVGDSDTLNRNDEVHITSPTPLHQSGGQVEVDVYHQRAEPVSLFGVLLSRIPNRQGLGFGTLGGIVLRVPSVGSLELGRQR